MITTYNKNLSRNDSDTWASAHKEDRNIQCVDTLRERPGKQSRRGMSLVLERLQKGPEDIRFALCGNNRARFRPPCPHSGLGPSYQRQPE
jgi:hypothetical protein